MTPDEALAIVATKAAGRTRWAGSEPYYDEVLAAEVRRLRALMPAYEWEAVEGDRYWLLHSRFGASKLTHGNVFEYYDGTAAWRYGNGEAVLAPSMDEAKRLLIEFVQTKAADPKAGG